MNKFNAFKIAIFFGILASIYSIWGMKSYALADPVYDLSPDAFNILEGGLQDNYNVGFGFSPEMFAYGFDQIYNDISWKIYNSTGFDLDEVGNPWYLTDKLGTAFRNRGGITDPYQQTATFLALGMSAEMALQQGYQIVSNNIANIPTYGRAIKNWFLGKVDDVTGMVTETTGKVISFVDDVFINSMVGTFDNAVENNDIVNMSNSPVYYSYAYDTKVNDSHYYLSFEKPVILFTGRSTSRGDVLFACYPKGEDIIGNGFVVNTSSGSRTDFSSFRYNTYYGSGDIVAFDGTVYYYAALVGVFDVIQSSVIYSQPLSSLSDVKAYLEGYNYDKPRAYDYSPTTSSGTPFNIGDILRLLLNNYITSDQSKQIIEVIHEFPTIPQEIVNPDTGTAETVPQIQPTDDQIADLKELVEQIVEDNKVLIEELGLPEPDPVLDPDPIPEPDPEPSPDYSPQGTEVPEGFPIPIFTPLISSLQLPFQFSSIFEPIFHTFGGFYGLFNMWLFLPSLLVILILIWALK